MENILAPGGRRITPPRNYARQPRLVRLDRWTLCLGWIILVVGLLLQAQPASGVTFLWNRSTGSNIAGYRLFYGTASGSYSQIIDVGNATSFTVNGLLRGHTYYFVVTAYDTTGAESGPSNQVAFSPGSSIKDFDGDGQSDLVWENTSTGERTIWFMRYGYLQDTADLHSVSTDWHIVGIGDFLGNGQADLVWENLTTGQRTIWFMVYGIVYGTANLPSVSTQWHIVGAGDFNGDGQADLVWENTTTGQRAIWFLRNGVLQRAFYLPTMATQWHIAGVGISDLVWENTTTGQRAIWFLKNGYLQRAIYLPTVSTQWHIAGVGDFLGNGQSDLVWQNTSTGQRAIWFMTNGYLQSTLNLPTVSTDWDIVEH